MPSVQNELLSAHIGMFDPGNLRRIDWGLAVLALALAIIGLITLYSATYGAAQSESIEEVSSLSWSASFREFFSMFFGRQLLYFLLGIAIAGIIVCTDYRILISLAPLFYVAILGLLILVLFAGHEARGGQRWLNLGIFNLQPSEFSKIVLIYMLAWYLSWLGPRITKIRYFALSFVLVAIPCALVVIQPSLSAALAMIPIVVVMLFASGCRLWHLGAIIVVGLIPLAMVGMQVRTFQEVGARAYEERSYPLGLKLKGYQIERILTFLDPERDPQDKGYQSIQMRITVGSGQMTGKGFGQGTQTHFKFLPEFHTDMIFALLAEEWGFVGATTVIGLFLAFFYRALALARACTDPAGSLLAVGCVTLLGFHAFTNIAITAGMLPVTGMPLPFLSYGGSFYLATMMCIGTLLSIHVRKRFFE